MLKVVLERRNDYFRGYLSDKIVDCSHLMLSLQKGFLK
jgi:hypothetical protein